MAAKRLILGGLAAGLTAAALLLGGVLTDGSAQEAGTVRVAAGIGESGAALLPQLQQQVRANPTDVVGLGLLGLAYQQRARETGDPSYYTKSEGVLRLALRYAPEDLVATGGLGTLALSRHRFRDALALGRRAVALSPSTARGYGVVGDALVELGRYREAFAAFDRMASLKPGLSSYARVSYARELLGDFRGAAQAMRLAVDAAVGQPEAVAWSQTQLGKLMWSQGRVAAAEHEYRSALAIRPGYVYALDGLAQVEAARGHLRRAVSYERRAVETIPLPQFVAALGDLEHLAGNETAARRQYALIGAIQKLLRANGVRTDLETAAFDVDHCACGYRRRSRSQRPHTMNGLRSTVTTCWPGPLPATVGARTRCTTRSVRCGSGRSTPRSSSTAAWWNAVSATKRTRRRGSVARCRSTRTSPFSGRPVARRYAA